MALVNLDAKGVGDVVSAVGNFAGQLRSAITGEASPELKLKQLEDALNAVQAGDKEQADVNLEEAKSTNWFVAGWRPFIGWICGLGFAWCVILYPLMQWGLTIFGSAIKIAPPDSSLIITTLGGMLGLGTMRTVEKLQSVQDNH